VLELDLRDADELVEPAELAAHHTAAVDGLAERLDLHRAPVELERARPLGHEHLAGDGELEEPTRLVGGDGKRLAYALELLDDGAAIAAIAQAAPDFGLEIQAFIISPALFPSASRLEPFRGVLSCATERLERHHRHPQTTPGALATPTFDVTSRAASR
jgi:hypothetical protein